MPGRRMRKTCILRPRILEQPASVELLAGRYSTARLPFFPLCIPGMPPTFRWIREQSHPKARVSQTGSSRKEGRFRSSEALWTGPRRRYRLTLLHKCQLHASGMAGTNIEAGLCALCRRAQLAGYFTPGDDKLPGGTWNFIVRMTSRYPPLLATDTGAGLDLLISSEPPASSPLERRLAHHPRRQWPPTA